MKTIENLIFVNGSAHKKGLKPMSESEKAVLESTIAKAKESGLKNFSITFSYNGKVYGFKTSIENCLNRVKANQQGKKTVIKMFFPVSLQTARELIENGKVTEYGTTQDLESIQEKKHLKNKGQAVEYLVNKKEHSTINHTQKLENGGDNLFGNCEIKFFALGEGTSPSVRLIEKKI